MAEIATGEMQLQRQIRTDDRGDHPEREGHEIGTIEPQNQLPGEYFVVAETYGPLDVSFYFVCVALQ